MLQIINKIAFKIRVKYFILTNVMQKVSKYEFRKGRSEEMKLIRKSELLYCESRNQELISVFHRDLRIKFILCRDMFNQEPGIDPLNIKVPKLDPEINAA